MKQATRLGLNESGVLGENELALLDSSDAEYLSKFVDVLAKKELDELLNKVNWIVVNSFAKREAINVLQSKIDSEFGKFISVELEGAKQGKIDVIVDTELNRSYNNGLLVGFKRGGRKMVQRIFNECSVCEECKAMTLDGLILDNARGLLPVHPGCDCSFETIA